MAGTEVLITSDKLKIPPTVASLLDPAQPLPPGVSFFEKQYTIDQMIRTGLLAVAFGLAALIIVPFGVAELFDRGTNTVSSNTEWLPLAFGCVCGLASWMMLSSILSAWRLRAIQLEGKPTRRGTFLTDDALIQAGENDTTIIPRVHFRGLQDNTVKYFHNNAEKSYRLPSQLIQAAPEQLHRAILEWEKVNVNAV